METVQELLKKGINKEELRDSLKELLKIEEYNLCYNCLRYIDPFKKQVFMCPLCSECFCLDCKTKMKIITEPCKKCDKNYPCDVCLKISEKCVYCQENKRFLFEHTLT
jgi:hypothetical protein